MALPRYDRYGSGPVRVAEPRPPERWRGGAGRTAGRGPVRESARKAALRRRRFAVIVVLPVLLMIGSVYLHTVAGGVEARVAGLEERLATAESQGQELEVRVAELSQPGRVRDLARSMGMQDAAGADIEVYGRDGEDGTEEDDRRGAHAAP